jgi:hypothetical protein
MKQLLDAQGALGDPQGLGHADDEFGFVPADGLFVGDEFSDEAVELFLAFVAGDDVELRAQAVDEAIVRDDLFSGFRTGAGTLLSIAPIGGDLFGCRHKYPFCKKKARG